MGRQMIAIYILITYLKDFRFDGKISKLKHKINLSIKIIENKGICWQGSCREYI